LLRNRRFGLSRFRFDRPAGPFHQENIPAGAIGRI
jgi:hypothetical protein